MDDTPAGPAAIGDEVHAGRPAHGLGGDEPGAVALAAPASTTAPALRTGAPVRRPRTPWAAMVLDMIWVALFALIGRLSHAEGFDLLGWFVTALPFLAGTAAGWAILLRAGRPRPASSTGGGIVWLCTVALGMVLRTLGGGGVQPSFVIVATIVTGLFLMGWRILGAYLVRRYP